jgi:YD repeat-containing protein
MRKLMYLFIATFALASCGGDDDPVYYPVQVTVLSKATVVSAGETYEYSIAYDEARRIKTITRTTTNNTNRVYAFSYDGSSRVSRVDITGSGPTILEFLYDGAGRLNAYIQNEQDTEQEITYDAVADLYTMPSNTFNFYGNNDIKRLDNYIFTYVDDKQGPMANINSSYHFLGLLADNALVYFATKRAIEAIEDTDTTLTTTFANTYNSDGFLETSVVTSIIDMSFEYTKAY